MKPYKEGGEEGAKNLLKGGKRDTGLWGGTPPKWGVEDRKRGDLCQEKRAGEKKRGVKRPPKERRKSLVGGNRKGFIWAWTEE